MQQLIYLLLVSLSFTSLSFFKLGRAEFTLFHALVIVVLFFRIAISLGRKKMKWKQPLAITIAIFYILAINTLNLGSIKISSFIFSLIILAEMTLLYNISFELNKAMIKKVVKTVILLYFINILIASVFIKFHIYPRGILGKVFQIYIFDSRVRPYGFSDEPSYAAIILVFSLYVLLKSSNFVYHKSEFIWHLICIVSIFLTGSSYGYLMLGLVLIYYVIKNRTVFRIIEIIKKHDLFTPIQIITIVSIFLTFATIGLSKVDVSSNKSINRIVTIFHSIVTSDEGVLNTIKGIAYFDGSASMRLVPTLEMIEAFKYDSWTHVLFGRGAGNSVNFFTKLYSGNITMLGFIPSFIYNYGIFGALLFITLFLSFFPKKKLFLFIIFIMFCLNADFNTQIFLFILFSLMVSKQLDQLPNTANVNIKEN